MRSGKDLPDEDRIRGVLVGLAVGDALGAPFEGHRHVEAERLEAQIARTGPLLWTDDTHMAMTLARTLVRDPSLTDPEGLGAAFAAAFREEPWRGYGPGPPQIFAMVERGASFEAAAGSLFDGTGSYGNGAAMRVAPVGLLPAATEPTELARIAEAQARTTHAHPEAIDGAIVVADVVASLLAMDAPSPVDLLDVVAMVVDRLRPGTIKERVQRVVEVASSNPVPGPDGTGGPAGIAARDSVPAAVAALLHGGSTLGAVTTAIGFGGDTDTVAAMAGAMAGAAWGLDDVPEGVLDRLEARDELGGLAVEVAGSRPRTG